MFGESCWYLCGVGEHGKEHSTVGAGKKTQWEGTEHLEEEKAAGATAAQGWSAYGQGVMGQRELHPLPNALDRRGQEGAPRHGRTHTAGGRALHMLGAK